jgi:peptide deformylase
MDSKDYMKISKTGQKQLHLRVLPDPVLRKVCMDIEVFDKRLQDFSRRMLSFMKKVKGIGLAAPQVGETHRIIAVGIHAQGKVLVNPSYVPILTDSDTKMEGCLSIPDETVNVSRLFRIEVRAHDTEGNVLHFAAHDILARVIQHEVDHLDGVLICDKNPDGTGNRERNIYNTNI